MYLVNLYNDDSGNDDDDDDDDDDEERLFSLIYMWDQFEEWRENEKEYKKKIYI